MRLFILMLMVMVMPMLILAKLDLLIEKNSKSEDLDEGKESQVDSLSNLVDEDEVEETEVVQKLL